ncbi:MBL fold metallo-hydrolase [Catenovulum sp. SM1970]|uniref:MBL fold metallo-hydrolase n=1 Tax=Marinifaba aquimaris TaxID=2741323 RepID=UPI00157300CD|nr:MBL fold metallo-hydrolase [Marinifaba aquimaris]NTS75726.1 MBL fold metallo-hydrolase [Marinifaba aquimaris]
MQVTFYGVRGSTPAPGAEYAKYGGNTACVHVQLSDKTHLILDSGTGIKKLGQVLAPKLDNLHLLLSHNHWDHIQGFPFFTPAFQVGRNITITPGLTSPDEPEAILNQMSGSWFPVDRQALLANITIEKRPESIASWQLGSATITRKKMNHPGSGSAYLIEENGTKLAYVTDNELYPPEHKETGFDEWVEFVKGADLLIHDGQYTQADLPLKHGWGHSLTTQALDLAVASKVKHCALYSHDHTRDDHTLEKIELELKKTVAQQNGQVDIFAAQEGMSLFLGNN